MYEKLAVKSLFTKDTNTYHFKNDKKCQAMKID